MKSKEFLRTEVPFLLISQISPHFFDCYRKVEKRNDAVSGDSHCCYPPLNLAYNIMIQHLGKVTVLLCMLGVSAYAPSSPTTKPNLPFGIETPSKQATRNSKASYDLGLGKNDPILPGEHLQTDGPANDKQAAQFWMAPRPAAQYPSPLEAKESLRKVSAPSKQSLVPVRLAEDALRIYTDSYSEHTVISPVSTGQQLDLNTIWVEALIHHQQIQMG